MPSLFHHNQHLDFPFEGGLTPLHPRYRWFAWFAICLLHFRGNKYKTIDCFDFSQKWKKSLFGWWCYLNRFQFSRSLFLSTLNAKNVIFITTHQLEWIFHSIYIYVRYEPWCWWWCTRTGNIRVVFVCTFTCPDLCISGIELIMALYTN